MTACPGPPASSLRAHREAQAVTAAACWAADTRDLFGMFADSLDDLRPGGDAGGELMRYGLRRTGDCLTHHDADMAVAQIHALSGMLRRASTAGLPPMYGRYAAVVSAAVGMFSDDRMADRLESAAVAYVGREPHTDG